MTPERSKNIAQKIADRTYSEEEIAEIISFLRSAPRKEADAWLEEYGLLLKEQLHPVLDSTGLANRIAARVAEAGAGEAKVRPLWRRWVAAAAVVLVLASGAYWWVAERNDAGKVPVFAETGDIDPGKEGAVLTLADGTQVVLDSVGNGWRISQNGSRVVLKDGQLAYDPAGVANGAVVYNTMSTPRGRQFRIVLPDGTKVWLNAASSIYYPTMFSGPQRKVRITGEAYFEVASHKRSKEQGGAWPFIVEVNGRAEVEVLGTHFNVNAYENEGSLYTTLLEGAVKVSVPAKAATPGGTVRLSPGQQARIANAAGAAERISLVKEADLEKVMAWRTGVFNFDDVGLEEAMRQLERWYDIEVVYEKGIPDIYFVGKISRSMPLKGVLKMLEESEVRFRLEEGRKLVVLP